MVDIHCHIIPLVDDGSKSFEETMNMARQAEKLGYDKIVATPHYIDTDVKVTASFIEDSIKKLNKEFKKNNIDIKMYAGNEVFFANDMYKLLVDKKALKIGNTRYVLFEFPMFNSKPLNMKDEVYNLIVSGYIPIIAHPERYIFTKEAYSDFIELIDMGALMQINLGSISGIYGKVAKSNVKKLLKKNMVHFIATDSHNSERIYSIYDKCMKKIRKIIGSEKLYLILGNGDKMLRDEDIEKFKIKR